jgi:hypothetical protein
MPFLHDRKSPPAIRRRYAPVTAAPEIDVGKRDVVAITVDIVDESTPCRPAIAGAERDRAYSSKTTAVCGRGDNGLQTRNGSSELIATVDTRLRGRELEGILHGAQIAGRTCWRVVDRVDDRAPGPGGLGIGGASVASSEYPVMESVAWLATRLGGRGPLPVDGT